MNSRQYAIEAIKDKIEAIKLDFDKRFLKSHMYASYSRVSLQRQWRLMNEQIMPLVREINVLEAEDRQAEIMAEIMLYQQMKRRKRKVNAA